MKLTLDGSWTFANAGSVFPEFAPFKFSPTDIPGFLDYLNTYTHFRLLKCYLHVGRNYTQGSSHYTVTTNNYVFVGSRPFAAIQRPITNPPTPSQAISSAMVPPQQETALRQTRWQKLKYPSSTSTKVTMGFYPYTLVTTGGPATNTANTFSYQRIWEAKRWMPTAWLGGMPQDTSNTGTGITFFGPYMIMDLASGVPSGEILNDRASAIVQLVVYCQFKGQR